MKSDRNYKYEVSLSRERMLDKVIAGAMTGSGKDPNNKMIRAFYNFSNGLSYYRETVTSEYLLESLLNGRVVCNLFQPKQFRVDGSFGSSEKNDKNFEGSYIIGVDIDHTSYKSREEYVASLSLEPSLSYTSFSNNLDGKGARFRLIYVFQDKIEGSYYFRYVANSLNQIISRDAGEEISDNCNIRCSQYFNGTNITNPEYRDNVSFSLSDKVYSLEDLGVTDQGYLEYLESYCQYKTKTPERTAEINSEILRMKDKLGIRDDQEKPSESKYEAQEEFSISPQLIRDMKVLDYDTFMKYNRHRYNYTYRAESGEWKDGIYQEVGEGYFSLYYNVRKVKDGEKRRKKLFERICLRRVMNPSIDPDTLLFNAYEDRYRFFEIDNDLSIDCLVKNVEAALRLKISDIEDQYSKNLEYLRGRKKGKYIFKSGEYQSKGDLKAVVWSKISDKYDPSKSLKENLKIINEEVNISERTLYNFCKERGIKTNQAKVTDEELLDMIDPEKSIRANIESLRNEGYKVKYDRVRIALKGLR